MVVGGKVSPIHFNGMRNYKFTLLDASFIVFSVCTFVADVVTDVVVAVYYFHGGQFEEAAVLLSLLICSTIIIHFFSMRWHVFDEEATASNWICNVLQLGIIHRYVLILKEGFSQRKRPDRDRLLGFLQHQSDVSMLRLFESFLESAPQLLLQLYLMFSTQHWNYFTEISAIISVLSLAGGIASYNKTQRNAHIHYMRLTWLGVFMQMFWRVGTLSSRILAMVLCASVLHHWFALIIFVHWLAMTIWVISQKTDFCPTPWEECLYNCIIGVIYCFCFFNLKEGQSRLRITTFYTIIFLENAVFTIIYYRFSNSEDPVFVVFLIIIATFFFFGILSMIIYYSCFHPRHRNKKSVSMFSFLSDQLSPASSVLSYGFLTLRSLKLTLPQWTQAKSETKSSISERSVPVTPEKLNFSILDNSLNQDIPLCGLSHDQKSHSLTCVYFSSTNTLSQDLYSSAPANHHRLVNYIFRSQVTFGDLHQSKIHCSCLILHPVSDDDDEPEFIVTRL